MKRLLTFALLAAVPLVSTVLLAQQPAASPLGLDPARLLKPATDAWPSYNGDYTGRRFSTLTKITDKNVGALSLAWVYRLNGAGATNLGSIKGTPLMVNGVIYTSSPDHVWALDARTGRELWHFAWKSTGGIHIANRGVALYNDWLFFETPDCNLVSLNIKDGTERWHQKICDLDLFYYGSVAPIIIKNMVIAGVSGDDLDFPGYLQAHDVASGELRWKWWVVPQKMGDPGSDTWPNEDAMKHGGGMTWQPVTYDPTLNHLYVSTGNPQPVIAHKNRKGDNLYTGSFAALDVDTGKMAWAFQSAPHDTHDWDSTQTPVLIDATINGQPRKLIAQAARNGHFFVVDRTNGKALVSTEYARPNWSSGYDAKGSPIPNPAKDPQIDGALVTPNQGGATNWPSPSYSPQTGLFYVSAARAWSIYYIYDPGDNPMGWGGTDRGGYSESMIQAIDITNGKIRWSHKWESGARSGLLTTAGNLLFAGGSSSDIVALNATTGDALWQARLNASVSNGPITYEMDGRQYLIVGAADMLWAFVMN